MHVGPRARMGCGILGLLWAGLAAGCGEAPCTEEAVAGAVITVKDGDGNRICDATVKVTADGEEEELEVQDPEGDCSYVGLYEKDGVYDLDVFRDGFAHALLGDALRIKKTKDGCHVVPVKKTVTLEAE